jgi:hypothetical protein
MKIIKSVTSEGISYIDDNGSQGFVDFKQCNENWIQYKKRSENLSEESLQGLSLSNVMNILTLKRLFANYKMISFLLDGQH